MICRATKGHNKAAMLYAIYALAGESLSGAVDSSLRITNRNILPVFLPRP
jgi:hypothetical protein